MTDSTPSAQESTILFRPSKKRKIYRQRAPSRSPSPEHQAQAQALAPLPVPAPQSLDELIAETNNNSSSEAREAEVEAATVPISEILRLRKLRKSKFVGGVEFRADSGHGAHHEAEAEGPSGSGSAVVMREQADLADGRGLVLGVDAPRKFASQTGAMGDVNKHMMAYIDSELAKRQAAQGVQQATTTSSGSSGRRDHHSGDVRKDVEVQRQPAALGKLHEIDLGDEARNRNVERTDRARRKLDGEEVEDEAVRRPGKVRLGRDGKPYRPRKRRGSEDVKRDKLVEDIFRENRLEIYDEPQEEAGDPDDDGAADDRIAEAFRKEFMDAVSQRQKKKSGPAAPPARGAGGKKEEEVLKGPKLGGSRNARAAMRETMLKNAKK